MTHTPHDDSWNGKMQDPMDPMADDCPELADEALRDAWRRLAPGNALPELDRDAAPQDATTAGAIDWLRAAFASLPTPDVDGLEGAGRAQPEIAALQAAWRAQPIPDPIVATEQAVPAESRWLRGALAGVAVPDVTAEDHGSDVHRTDALTDQTIRWTADAYQGVRLVKRPAGRILRLTQRITPLRAAAAVLFATLTAGAIQSSLQPKPLEAQGPATALQMRIAGDWTSFPVPSAPMQASILPPIVFDLNGAACFAGLTFGAPLTSRTSDDPVGPLRAAVAVRDYTEALRLGDAVLAVTHGATSARAEVLAILANCARGLGQIEEANRHQDALIQTLAEAESDAGSRRATMTPRREALGPVALNRHTQLVEETGAEAARVIWRDQKVADWRRDGVAADAGYEFDPGVILALIAGRKIDEGALQLDDAIDTHLPAAARSATPITVRHLLTHTAGLSLDHRGRLIAKSTPGVFRYDEASMVALQAVLAAVTDGPLGAYAARYVFGPIGAATARLDAVDGTPRLTAGVADMARIGELILHRGRSGAMQLVPAAWVDRMVAPSHERADHGFLVWLTDEPAGMASLGPFDSNLYVLPSQDLVIVRAQTKPFLDSPKSYEPEAQSLFGLIVDRE